MHPRGLLAQIVAEQCSGDSTIRERYREEGHREFFSTRETTSEPIRALAEFLSWFTLDDEGQFNDFRIPIAAVGSLLGHYRIVHDLRAVLKGLKSAFDAGHCNVDVIDAALRGSVFPKA